MDVSPTAEHDRSVLGLMLPPADFVSAQTAKDLVGAWTTVSVTVEQGDKKFEPIGPNRKGPRFTTPPAGLPTFRCAARQPENERCADPLRNALGAMPPDQRHQQEPSNVRCAARRYEQTGPSPCPRYKLTNKIYLELPTVAT